MGWALGAWAVGAWAGTAWAEQGGTPPTPTPTPPPPPPLQSAGHAGKPHAMFPKAGRFHTEPDRPYDEDEEIALIALVLARMLH